MVVGGGIGGLTTALELPRVGLPCTVIEAVERFVPVAVGINVLPHVSRQLAEFGLEAALSSTAYVTEEELAGITEGYGAVAGYTRSGLERPS